MILESYQEGDGGEEDGESKRRKERGLVVI